VTDADETWESIRLLTSILRVVSIVSQREHKQWFWKIPEVELDDVSEMNLRNHALAMVAMTDLEKCRNGMDVVRRAERK
jgi:hypothetical protein